MRGIAYSESQVMALITGVRSMFKQGPVKWSLVPADSRSLDQNAIGHVWYEQVALETGEDDARGVKRFCKLHFGVPILRVEDDEFREAYDATIKHTLTYEQKLQAMDVLPVTSRMNKGQKSRYLESMQDHYRPRGVILEFPEQAIRRAA